MGKKSQQPSRRRINLVATLRDDSNSEIRVISSEAVNCEDLSKSCLELLVKNLDDPRLDPEELAILRLLKDIQNLPPSTQ